MNLFEFSCITADSIMKWVDTLITLPLREISTADTELSLDRQSVFSKPSNSVQPFILHF